VRRNGVRKIDAIAQDVVRSTHVISKIATAGVLVGLLALAARRG
jgi:hypothetical protein